MAMAAAGNGIGVEAFASMYIGGGLAFDEAGADGNRGLFGAA